jgi:aminoglycoside/choline kinase family phosphotransferase
VNGLYAEALAALCDIQTADRSLGASLPPYNAEVLKREMQLMPDWFVAQHLQVPLSVQDAGMLSEQFEMLSCAAIEQPQVFVHRDYHSRNLLVTKDRNPGIIDFQDAMWGPITYDVVSLLKDCYITWPAERVRSWALGHRDALVRRGVELGDPDEYLRCFDLMGLQRHIKVLGIFARLFYRDGKSQYLSDLPRVLAYALDTAHAYPETAPLARFLDRMAPHFESAQRRAFA